MANVALERVWQDLRRRARDGAPRPAGASAPVRRIAAAGLQLDYSRALFDEDLGVALDRLASAAEFSARFEELFAGAELNFTERRPAWHSELRKPAPQPAVADELERVCAFAAQVRAGQITGAAGKRLRVLLHIGIGGSFLGPKLLAEALAEATPDLPALRFVANVDPAAMTEALAGLDPATTMVIGVSKSGTTAETGDNARRAYGWLVDHLGASQARRQIVAISASTRPELIFGTEPGFSFAIWDWVGGRYSLWSAVSLAAAVVCGPEAFRALLAGAHAMDLHVAECVAKPATCMPVRMALLRVWHSLATGAQTHCVVAYAYRLRSLAAYLQQLAMESNGKSACRAGGRPELGAEIWWGGEGTNDQHSYYQFLLQGGACCPVDFIAFLKPAHAAEALDQRKLLAHCLGASRALMLGRDLAASRAELLAAGAAPEEAARLAPHLVVPGGQPSNILLAPQLTAQVLGALLACYEHQVAAAGWLTDINSFDQFGVELAKQNFRSVFAALEGDSSADLDPVTASLVELARSHAATAAKDSS